jgi:hypothetical protein
VSWAIVVDGLGMQMTDTTMPREAAAGTEPPSESPGNGWADILYAVAERKRREESERLPRRPSGR